MSNYFSDLNSVDVSSKIEKKNGLSYLSWAFAWGELKKRYPDSYYTIYENKDGMCYHTDGRTCWVKTGVTVIEEMGTHEHIEYLPVMDARNRSIPVDSVTSFDVNKAIQRSLTKAVARHGLGLYVYAGEDLPEGADEAVQKPAQTAPRAMSRKDAIQAICDRHGMDMNDFEMVLEVLRRDGKVVNKKVNDMTVDEVQTMLLQVESTLQAKK